MFGGIKVASWDAASTAVRRIEFGACAAELWPLMSFGSLRAINAVQTFCVGYHSKPLISLNTPVFADLRSVHRRRSYTRLNFLQPWPSGNASVL